MGERKVKDAVDLETKEKIYFKGHAKATYMSDGTTVEDAINQSMGSGSEKLVVSVSGITEGFTVYVMSEDGDVIGSQTTNYKTYRIKEGVRYYVKAEEVVGYFTPNKSETYTAYDYAEREINMVYNRISRTTIRINQTISDPSAMITRIVDEGGIEAIRANSHRYVGVFDSMANVMSLRQLDDNDGTKYLNGTAAPITTFGCDVWMKLPKFYWKCIEHATDVWDFSVAYGGKPDDTFKEWDGKDLIGAYEAYVSSSKLYSVSGVVSTGSVSQANFKTYARSRGEGFTLVKWKHHCMMAMLFYTYYCNTNSQSKVGHGSMGGARITGGTNSLCMLDTIGGVNGETDSITFWGIENWWGNKYEYIDNVTTNNGQTNSSWSIVEDDGSLRNVECPFVQGFLRKAKFGNFIDIVASGSTIATATTGYCDNFYIEKNTTNRVLRRSFSGEGSIGGISYIDSYVDNSSAHELISSRLAFRGEIVIES